MIISWGREAQHTLDLSLRLRKMHSAATGKRFTAAVIPGDLQLRFYAFYASNPNLNVRPDAQCVITSPPVLYKLFGRHEALQLEALTCILIATCISTMLNRSGTREQYRKVCTVILNYLHETKHSNQCNGILPRLNTTRVQPRICC